MLNIVWICVYRSQNYFISNLFQPVLFKSDPINRIC